MGTILKITTRKKAATGTEGEEIVVTATDGRTAAYPYPYREALDGIEAHEHCIGKFITREEFDRIESFYKTGDTASGYTFAIFLND